MDNLIGRLDAWVIALTFAAAMTAFFSLGSWWGRRVPVPAGDSGARFTDASMALLGLLLAFTFSMALNRYDDRRAATVAESNAIGDLYTCATLLPEPSRSQLQTLLADYTTRRLEERRRRALRYEPELVMREAHQMHTRATSVVAAMVSERSPITVPLVNTLNDVTSSYAAYLAAYRERLPGVVLVLLMAGSINPGVPDGSTGSLEHRARVGTDRVCRAGHPGDLRHLRLESAVRRRHHCRRGTVGAAAPVDGEVSVTVTR